MTIPELSGVRLRTGKVEDVDRFAADEGWEPAAGMEGVVVHAYPAAPVYVVEILGPGGTLALLDVREEDLEVTWIPGHGHVGTDDGPSSPIG